MPFWGDPNFYKPAIPWQFPPLAAVAWCQVSSKGTSGGRGGRASSAASPRDITGWRSVGSSRVRQRNRSGIWTSVRAKNQRAIILHRSSVRDGNLASCIVNGHTFNVGGRGRGGPTSVIRFSISRVFSNGGFSTRSKGKPLGNLGAFGVILISRQSNSGQNTNDRYNDHQLDQGKTFLHLSFHLSLQSLSVRQTACLRASSSHANF